MGTLGTLDGVDLHELLLRQVRKRADCQEHRSAYVVIIKPVHQGDRFVESVKTLSILGAVFVILTLFLLPLFEGLRWALQSCPCHFVSFGFRGRTFVRRLPLHQAGLFYETRSVSVAAAAAVWLAVCTASTTCVAAVLIWLPSWGRC